MFRFFCALVLVSPAFSETTLEPVATRIWSVPLAVPAQSKLVSLEPESDTPRAVYTINRVGLGGTFVETWDTEHASTTFTFTAAGELISEHHVNKFRKTGIDVSVDAGRTSVRTVMTEQGKVKSDKTTRLTPNIALREELSYLVIQAWRAGIRNPILCQSLAPDGGMVGDFQIVFDTVSDPTVVSKIYAYPDEFTAAFPRAQYVVADMSLRGIASMFFPHHFYLVYTIKPDGLEWVGYFGEDPKKPIFQFTPKRG